MLFSYTACGVVHTYSRSCYSLPALDVSADLVELGRTPVAVVCGGVKSILDIGRTLEVLVSWPCACSVADSQPPPKSIVDRAL